MKSSWLGLLLVLAAAPTVASEPVYLRCTFDQDRANFDVTLDESNSTANVTMNGGFNDRAAFSPTEVRFVERDSYGSGYYGRISFVTIRAINRVDMSSTVEYKVLSSGVEQEGSGYLAKGSCEKLSAPERAF